MDNNVCIVGSIPNPIGGISSYLQRLCQKVEVDVFLDLYPSDLKSFEGLKIKDYRVSPFKGVLKYIWLAYQLLTLKVNLVVFNFSTFKALLPVLFFPKFAEKYHCVLHNGTPFSNKKINSGVALKLLRAKFDCCFSLNDNQRDFYKRNNIEYKDYKSYVPVNCQPNIKFDNNRVILSGYPKNIYNFAWIEKIAPKYEWLHFDIYLYGEGYEEQALSLVEKLKNCYNVKVYRDTPPDEFLQKLSNAAYYIRLNSVDSFGIVVADSVNFGLKVLASDCCERYPGTYLFSTGSYESFAFAFQALTCGEFLQLKTQKSIYDYLKGYSKVIEV